MAVDISYDDFEHHPAESPPTIVGSTKIKKVTIILLVSITLSLLLLFLLVVVFLYCRRREVTRNTQHESKPPRNGDLFSIWNYDGNIAYEDIINAT